jgi:hypothetical protein
LLQRIFGQAQITEPKPVTQTNPYSENEMANFSEQMQKIRDSRLHPPCPDWDQAHDLQKIIADFLAAWQGAHPNDEVSWVTSGPLATFRFERPLTPGVSRQESFDAYLLSLEPLHIQGRDDRGYRHDLRSIERLMDWLLAIYDYAWTPPFEAARGVLFDRLGKND